MSGDNRAPMDFLPDTARAYIRIILNPNAFLFHKGRPLPALSPCTQKNDPRMVGVVFGQPTGQKRTLY
jgi:hypothetical protein